MKEENVTATSETRNTMSEKETLVDKSAGLVSENPSDTKKTSDSSENTDEPVWIEEKGNTQLDSKTESANQKEINRKNLIREQIF